MHGKIKNILKKTALLLTLGITCLTAVSIGKPQKVQDCHARAICLMAGCVLMTASINSLHEFHSYNHPIKCQV